MGEGFVVRLQPNGNVSSRVMVDANILIAGIAFPRWSYEILRHVLRGDIRLVLCPYIIEQATRHIQKRFPDHLNDFRQFLASCEYESVPDPSPDEVAQHHDLVRDLSDVPIAWTAIHAQVDYLVSEDKDLTAVDETTRELRKKIQPLIAGTFLRMVMGWKSEDLDRVRRRTWRDMPPPFVPVS